MSFFSVIPLGFGTRSQSNSVRKRFSKGEMDTAQVLEEGGSAEAAQTKKRRPAKVFSECHTGYRLFLSGSLAAAVEAEAVEADAAFTFFRRWSGFFRRWRESLERTEPRCSQVLPLIKFTLAAGRPTQAARAGCGWRRRRFETRGSHFMLIVRKYFFGLSKMRQ